MNQCVFIKGYRATRRLFRIKALRAAAEPLPDDPDNSREDPVDEIQVTPVPDAPKVGSFPMAKWRKTKYDVLIQYRDPLIGVLDYITEVCLHGYARLRQAYSAGSKRIVPRAP